jgi:hypothetical protein
VGFIVFESNIHIYNIKCYKKISFDEWFFNYFNTQQYVLYEILFPMLHKVSNIEISKNNGPTSFYEIASLNNT